MNAALYARVSTSQQMEEGSSLGSQIAILTQLATEKGYQISQEFIFEEDWSGEDLERPQLDRLRSVAREGQVSAIFVYSNDRLSRDPLHFLLLVDEWQKQEIEIFFAKEPLDTSEEGKLIAYVRGYASKLEAIRIRDRVRRGLRARAEKGLIIGGHRLYGYHYIVGNEPGEGRRVVNEEEANIVRKIFRWAVEERMSGRAIGLRLQGEGIAAPAGGRIWHVATVNRILHCEQYRGRTYAFRTRAAEPTYRRKDPKKVHHKKTARRLRPSEDWIELPEATPAIISEELFMAAQHQLRKNAINSPRNRKHQYLLSGHIRCQCGWSMGGLTAPPHYVYYRCRRSNKQYAPDQYTSKCVRAREIESLVWGEIKKALSSPKAIWKALERRQESLSPERLEGDLEEARREIKRLKKQEQKLIYLFRVGEYDEELLEVETRRLKQVQRQANSEYQKLNRQWATMSQAAEQMKSLETYCEWASQNLENLDFEQKRLVLEALDLKVVVDRKEVMIRGFLPVGSPSFLPAFHEAKAV